ncbi:unnamed protein product [Vitrella brassicaformis CCMP3155]|uniref:Uncharacterized protein n=1 Tax=Vitrella brassicaformis (strain CCMP3155) TaxID=1169540 RepID=A0A0G4F8N0_VITBC|nr:unnamed protein product [Vitrella brassicaformis CCMP3155]|eukprot:CEM09063.1 unnamed protein product [Vitrella brassicaformis CCMP3155]
MKTLLCLVSALLLAAAVMAGPALRAASTDLDGLASDGAFNATTVPLPVNASTDVIDTNSNAADDAIGGKRRVLQRYCPQYLCGWLGGVIPCCRGGGTPPAPNPPPPPPTGCGPSSPCCDRKIQEVWVQACAKTCDAVRQAGGCMAVGIPDFLKPLACAKKCFEQMNTMPDCMCSGLPNGALPCPPLKSEWDDRCCALSGGCSR